MFWAKLHTNNKSTILAVCDSDIIDNVYSDQHGTLDLRTCAYFYKGSRLSSKAELEVLLRTGASSINLTGEKTIEVAINIGIVKKENVKIVGGIPHAQVYYI